MPSATKARLPRLLAASSSCGVTHATESSLKHAHQPRIGAHGADDFHAGRGLNHVGTRLRVFLSLPTGLKQNANAGDRAALWRRVALRLQQLAHVGTGTANDTCSALVRRIDMIAITLPVIDHRSAAVTGAGENVELISVAGGADHGHAVALIAAIGLGRQLGDDAFGHGRLGDVDDLVAQPPALGRLLHAVGFLGNTRITEQDDFWPI